MTGYSTTPLFKKLGIAADMTVTILNSDFEVPDLPNNVGMHRSPNPSDIFIVFSTLAADAACDFAEVTPHLPPDGAIWMAWPKKSSGVPTDITENVLRDLFLPTGMVDNKVCAINDTWSGLRFVVRRENRPNWNQTAQ